MGAEFSHPVPPSPLNGVFCLLFCPPKKIRLLHAPPEVKAAVTKVVKHVNSLSHGCTEVVTPQKERMGATQFTMLERLFTTNNGKEAATLGKQLCVELLQELHKLGYDLQLSSDLARSRWQSATLFFRKMDVERPASRVVCVAPGKNDMITLLSHDERVRSSVEDAIKETWPKGIQSAHESCVLGLTMYDIQMNGTPWFTSEADIDDTRIICRIVSKLSKLGLRLVGGIDIKGGTDSLFFIQGVQNFLPVAPAPQFCAISLCKRDRLRLVDCKDMSDSVQQVIHQNGFQIQDNSVREHHAKLRVSGTPWRCSGSASVRSRQLISRISEEMLRQGWALTDAIDNSRREDDKSMLLYRRCPPISARFCCLSLTSKNHLRLIDFLPEEMKQLSRAASTYYLPGLQSAGELESEPGSLKIKMAGSPWSHPGGTDLGWALHARSLLLHLLHTTHQLGYRPAVSADVSAKCATDSDGNPVYPLDVHTIYLVRMEENRPPSYQETVSVVHEACSGALAQACDQFRSTTEWRMPFR